MSNSQVSLIKLERNEIHYANLLTGITPTVLRRVFGSWVFFIAIVCIIVTLAPDISYSFIIMTYSVLLLFSVIIFAQSRISEGWPTIIEYENKIGVVQDPIERQFIMVPYELIDDVAPTTIKPNKRGLVIRLNTDALTDEDKAILERAIWPREDKLIAMVYLKKREVAAEEIKAVYQDIQ